MAGVKNQRNFDFRLIRDKCELGGILAPGRRIAWKPGYLEGFFHRIANVTPVVTQRIPDTSGFFR